MHCLNKVPWKILHRNIVFMKILNQLQLHIQNLWPGFWYTMNWIPIRNTYLTDNFTLLSAVVRTWTCFSFSSQESTNCLSMLGTRSIRKNPCLASSDESVLTERMKASIWKTLPRTRRLALEVKSRLFFSRLLNRARQSFSASSNLKAASLQTTIFNSLHARPYERTLAFAISEGVLALIFIIFPELFWWRWTEMSVAGTSMSNTPFFNLWKETDSYWKCSDYASSTFFYNCL